MNFRGLFLGSCQVHCLQHPWFDEVGICREFMFATSSGSANSEKSSPKITDGPQNRDRFQRSKGCFFRTQNLIRLFHFCACRRTSVLVSKVSSKQEISDGESLVMIAIRSSRESTMIPSFVSLTASPAEIDTFIQHACVSPAVEISSRDFHYQKFPV